MPNRLPPSSLLRAALCGPFFFSLAPCARTQNLPLAPRILYQIEGEGPGQRFGAGTWPLDDVDGDGLKDLLITDYWVGSVRDPSPPIWVETARVYSGADGRELFELEYDYPEVSMLAVFGTNFAQLGDLDGDGTRDFIVGDPNTDIFATLPRDGFAAVFSGRTGEVIRTHRSPAEGFGTATQALGDLDGDGTSDYTIETQKGSGLGGNPSAVAIHSGASGEKQGTITGFGTRAIGVKDLDGDGLGDLAIVDEENNSVWFLSGLVRGTHAIDNVPAELVLSRYRNDVLNVAASHTGHTFHNVGDLDGDGFDEVAARLDERPADKIGPGGLVAISSKTGQALWVHRLSFNDEMFHQRYSLEPLVRVRDLSGDGIPELLTADGVNALHTRRQGVLVLSGADGSELFFMPSEIPRELAALSDLDGDGVEEVAVSDRNWNGKTGRVLVYSFGPGAASPLELAVTTDDQGAVIVSWPEVAGEVVLERSENLVGWLPVEDAIVGNRYVVPPGSPPQQFYRLRYTP